MNSGIGSDEFYLQPERRRLEQPFFAILVVCLLMFIDTALPLVGSSNRLLSVLALFLMLLYSGAIRTPFCGVMAALLAAYFIFLMLVHQDVSASHSWKVLIFHLLSLSGMVILAHALQSERSRRTLIDTLVILALVVSVIACLQRFVILEQLGRHRWADYFGSGVGLMSDPNFLAVLLACVVPIIVSWRFTRLRAPALFVLALGLYSTNSRAGMFLAVAALSVSIIGRVSTNFVAFSSRGRRSVILVAVGLVCLFLFNVGGQRDRVIHAMLIELGLSSTWGGADPTDTFVAHERRQALEAWVKVGMDNFPFGVGSGSSAELSMAAHNTIATLFGEGGIVGLAVGAVLLLCLAFFVRRRSEPFAVMGAVIILGGLFLSYLGSVFLVIPMGLADGILAARLGIRTPSAPAPSHTTSPSAVRRGQRNEGKRPAASLDN